MDGVYFHIRLLPRALKGAAFTCFIFWVKQPCRPSFKETVLSKRNQKTPNTTIFPYDYTNSVWMPPIIESS